MGNTTGGRVERLGPPCTGVNGSGLFATDRDLDAAILDPLGERRNLRKGCRAVLFAGRTVILDEGGAAVLQCADVVATGELTLSLFQDRGLHRRRHALGDR